MTEESNEQRARAKEIADAVVGKSMLHTWMHEETIMWAGAREGALAALRTPRPLDAEVVARVQEAMARHKGCALEQGITPCALRISDVRALLEALT